MENKKIKDVEHQQNLKEAIQLLNNIENDLLMIVEDNDSLGQSLDKELDKEISSELSEMQSTIQQIIEKLNLNKD